MRNAYLLVTADGVAGRHDKDLPTMWENAFCIGGHDDGVIAVGDLTVGAAVCWELMRTQPVHRLRGRIDPAMTGSGWWSVPCWHPASAFRWLETRNAASARRAAESFAGYVGASVLHAAHVGALRCRMPWLPVDYVGRFEGATMIVAADGTVLASRGADEGAGVVVADIEPLVTESRTAGALLVAWPRSAAHCRVVLPAPARPAVLPQARRQRRSAEIRMIALRVPCMSLPSIRISGDCRQ